MIFKKVMFFQKLIISICHSRVGGNLGNIKAKEDFLFFSETLKKLSEIPINF